MDSPKHQSDPSEDEDERSTQKVVREKIPFPKSGITGNLRQLLLKVISPTVDFPLCRIPKGKCIHLLMITISYKTYRMRTLH